MPLISVIMPTYNNLPEYVEQAVKSILNQTLGDFEFLIIDDSTNTDTIAAINALAQSDPRIKVIREKQRLGLVPALNLGLKLAKGKYIARIDADDISMPDRFERQIRFLKKHPNYGLCGTWAKCIDETGKIIDKITFPTKSNALHISLLLQNPIMHSAVMLNKNIFGNLEYNNGTNFPEDYDLWERMAQQGIKMYNIPRFLLLYRLHNGNLSNSIANYSTHQEIRQRQSAALGILLSEEEMKINMSVTQLQDINKEMLPDIEQYFLKLLEANKKKAIYKHSDFTAFLTFRWLLACISLKEKQRILKSSRMTAKLFHPIVLYKTCCLMFEKVFYK